MTQVMYDQLKNKVILSFQIGKRIIKDLQRKVGSVFDYNESGTIYKTLRLNVCNPDIDVIGLAVELVDYCRKSHIDLLAWQDPNDEYKWKYVRVKNVDTKSYPPVQGVETNDHKIPTDHFKAFANQSEPWMIKLHYRFKRNDRKPERL